MPPAAFQDYLLIDGRAGTRNYIALTATVNCSATAIRQAASEIGISGLLEHYENVDGIVAFTHGTGCEMPSEGRGIEIFDCVIWGHITHLNVGSAIIVGLGCEVMHIGRLLARYGNIRTAVLSETPEIYGAEQLLLPRASRMQ